MQVPCLGIVMRRESRQMPLPDRGCGSEGAPQFKNIAAVTQALRPVTQALRGVAGVVSGAGMYLAP